MGLRARIGWASTLFPLLAVFATRASATTLSVVPLNVTSQTLSVQGSNLGPGNTNVTSGGSSVGLSWNFGSADGSMRMYRVSGPNANSPRVGMQY